MRVLGEGLRHSRLEKSIRQLHLGASKIGATIAVTCARVRERASARRLASLLAVLALLLGTSIPFTFGKCLGTNGVDAVDA